MHKRSILLVDDEPSILEILQLSLKSNDYVIYTALSAEDGLNIMEQNKVDLIISDQRMPGMNGLEFLEQTVENHPDTVRIILTGFPVLNDTVRAINSGCIFKYILKPCNYDELKLTVESALVQRDILRRKGKLQEELHLREKAHSDLEKKYPGITKRPDDGVYTIDMDN